MNDEGYILRTGDICIVRTDGTGLTPLAADAAKESQPAWSPDGRGDRLRRRSEKALTWYPPGSALYVVNADGSGLSEVPNTGKVWDPAWRLD